MRPTATLDASLLEEGTITRYFLGFVQYLDANYGANEWTTREVALISFALFLAIRLSVAKTYGVLWYPLLHGALSGYLSFVAVWISQFGAEPLTGMTEPLRSVLCQGPLTSLHRIVPAITMGYGLFDIFDGAPHGIDFLAHGIATFTIFLYFCEYGVPEIIVPMLMMEISTVHLNLFHTTLFNTTASAANMGLFALTFFVFRWLLCPYLWWGIFTTSYAHRHDPVSRACLPWHFSYVVFSFGMLFHILNLFWGYKVIQKIKRKLSGKEKIKENNVVSNLMKKD